MDDAAVVLREQDVTGIGAAGENFGVNQALGVPLADALDSFFVLLAVQANAHVAFLIGVPSILDTEQGEQSLEHVIGVGQAGEVAHFIFLAVAIGVLVDKGGKHIMELVHRGGSFHAYSVQPVLAHKPGLGNQALVYKGNLVDVAVCRGDGALDVRVFIQDFLEIRSILLNQVVQGHKGALHAVLVD